MNELALKLDTTSLQQAQNLAARFKAGDWQAPVVRSIPEGDARLKLNGITFGGRTPMAVINGKTLSEGESAKLRIEPRNLNIKCLKIEKDSVVVAIEGEDAPRLLRLK
jgi:type II secretory pathway component PulC